MKISAGAAHANRLVQSKTHVRQVLCGTCLTAHMSPNVSTINKTV